MSNRLRRILALSCAALLLSSTAIAQTTAQGDAANAPVVIDVMLLRPAGFVGLIVGAGLFVTLTPIILVTRPHEIAKPWNALVGKPARYLWVDPLGGH